MTQRLDDGFSTIIFPLSNPTLFEFWEKSVTPPGFDGGNEIDVTDMYNQHVTTKAPRSLIDVTEMTAKVSYNPDVIDSILESMNLNIKWKISFPDDDFVTFWGFLKSFKPDEIKIGDQPMAEIKIVVTNQSNDIDAQGRPFEVMPLLNANVGDL